MNGLVLSSAHRGSRGREHRRIAVDRSGANLKFTPGIVPGNAMPEMPVAATLRRRGLALQVQDCGHTWRRVRPVAALASLSLRCDRALFQAPGVGGAGHSGGPPAPALGAWAAPPSCWGSASPTA